MSLRDWLDCLRMGRRLVLLHINPLGWHPASANDNRWWL